MMTSWFMTTSLHHHVCRKPLKALRDSKEQEGRSKEVAEIPSCTQTGSNSAPVFGMFSANFLEKLSMPLSVTQRGVDTLERVRLLLHTSAISRLWGIEIVIQTWDEQMYIHGHSSLRWKPNQWKIDENCMHYCITYLIEIRGLEVSAPHRYPFLDYVWQFRHASFSGIGIPSCSCCFFMQLAKKKTMQTDLDVANN